MKLMFGSSLREEAVSKAVYCFPDRVGSCLSRRVQRERSARGQGVGVVATAISTKKRRAFCKAVCWEPPPSRALERSIRLSCKGVLVAFLGTTPFPEESISFDA